MTRLLRRVTRLWEKFQRKWKETNRSLRWVCVCLSDMLCQELNGAHSSNHTQVTFNAWNLCNLHSSQIRNIKTLGGTWWRKQSINVVAVIEWVTTFDNTTHLMSHIHRAVIAPNSSTLLMRVKTFRQTQHSFAHYTDLSEMTTWPSLVIPCWQGTIQASRQ